MHRARIVSAGGGCFVRCTVTNETAVADRAIVALTILNGRCGCKHKKDYIISEEVDKYYAKQYMRIRGGSITERNTVEALNARVTKGGRR